MNRLFIPLYDFVSGEMRIFGRSKEFTFYFEDWRPDSDGNYTAFQMARQIHCCKECVYNMNNTPDDMLARYQFIE